MQELSFFTAVKYKDSHQSWRTSLLEKVDNYFYLGGKKAYVLQREVKEGPEQVVLSVDHQSSKLARVAKVISYFTVVIPVVLLLAKAILRNTHQFKVIDPKASLEQDIHITDMMIKWIQMWMPQIREGDKNCVEWLGRGLNWVFMLENSPNIVFKMVNPAWKDYVSNERRFDNMVKAKEICLIHNLKLLIIPQAKKFDIEVDGKKITLIAEKKLEINQNRKFQRESYHKYSTQLNETARQLAIFVAETGFNDVVWRNIPILTEAVELLQEAGSELKRIIAETDIPLNIPILEESAAYTGQRSVGLIDLEHMNSVTNGFAGDENGSPGLIGCVSEKQIDIVIEVARRYGVSEIVLQNAKARRLEELKAVLELIK